MDLRTMAIQKPWLSPVLFSQYHKVVNFKEYFHNLRIKAKKDVEGIWYEFPYLVTKKDIFSVVSN